MTARGCVPALLLASCLHVTAWAAPAISTADYAKLPVCTLSADGSKLAVEPCRTAPAMNPMPRRPVPQIIQRMPAQPRPRAVPMAHFPPAPSLQSPPRALVPANNCVGGGCLDSGGARHIESGNNVSVTPGGRTCVRNGAFLQCS